MFKPLNRYIHVEMPQPAPTELSSGVVLPRDYAPTQEAYGIVKVKSWAPDVRFAEKLSEGDKIIINQSMVEEIIISKEKFTVVLDNYVIGIL